MASLESSTVLLERLSFPLNVASANRLDMVWCIGRAHSTRNKQLWGIDNEMLWSAAIRLLILVWVAVGITNLES